MYSHSCVKLSLYSRASLPFIFFNIYYATVRSFAIEIGLQRVPDSNSSPRLVRLSNLEQIDTPGRDKLCNIPHKTRDAISKCIPRIQFPRWSLKSRRITCTHTCTPTHSHHLSIVLFCTKFSGRCSYWLTNETSPNRGQISLQEENRKVDRTL